MKLVFAHIPKTAGSSVFQLLSNLYPPDAICPARFDEHLNNEMIASEQYKLYFGHYSFEKVKILKSHGAKVMSAFRDPVDRQISHYRYFNSMRASSFSPEEVKNNWYIFAAITLSPIDYFSRKLLGVTYEDNLYVRYLSRFAGPKVGEREFLVAMRELENIDWLFLSNQLAYDLPDFVSKHYGRSVVLPHANAVEMNSLDFSDRFRQPVPSESCDAVRDYLQEINEFDYKLMASINNIVIHRKNNNKILSSKFNLLSNSSNLPESSDLTNPQHFSTLLSRLLKSEKPDKCEQIILENPRNPVEFSGADTRLFTQCGQRDDTCMISNLEAGFLIYGPYIRLASGRYEAHLSLLYDSVLIGAWMDVVSSSGNICWAKLDLPQPPVNTVVVLEFELTEVCADIEVRLWVPAGADVKFNSLCIEQIIKS